MKIRTGAEPGFILCRSFPELLKLTDSKTNIRSSYLEEANQFAAYVAQIPGDSHFPDDIRKHGEYGGGEV